MAKKIKLRPNGWSEISEKHFTVIRIKTRFETMSNWLLFHEKHPIMAKQQFRHYCNMCGIYWQNKPQESYVNLAIMHSCTNKIIFDACCGKLEVEKF